MSGRWRGPNTVKYRSATERKPWIRSNQWSSRSTITFDSPYGLTGWIFRGDRNYELWNRANTGRHTAVEVAPVQDHEIASLLREINLQRDEWFVAGTEARALASNAGDGAAAAGAALTAAGHDVVRLTIDRDGGWDHQRTHLAKRLAQCSVVTRQVRRITHGMTGHQPLHDLGFERLDDEYVHAFPGSRLSQSA